MRPVTLPRVGRFAVLVPAAVRMRDDMDEMRRLLGSRSVWVHGSEDNPEFMELVARCRRWYTLRQQAKRKGRHRAR